MSSWPILRIKCCADEVLKPNRSGSCGLATLDLSPSRRQPSSEGNKKYQVIATRLPHAGKFSNRILEPHSLGCGVRSLVGSARSAC